MTVYVNVTKLYLQQLLQTLTFVIQFFGEEGERNANVLHHIFLLSPTYGYVLCLLVFCMYHIQCNIPYPTVL